MILEPLQFGVFDLFQDLNAFLILMIGVGMACGIFSRKLTITAYGGLMVYVYIVIETDVFIFDAILYLVLTIILLWVASYVVSGYLEAGQGGEA